LWWTVSGSLFHPGHGQYNAYSDDGLAGPNPGYGFDSAGPLQSMRDHTTAIRYFLADIAPANDI